MDIVFNMPADRAELLNDLSENYTVRNVIIPGEIIQKLSEAQDVLRDEGANFIVDHFDTYYSVLHHAEALRLDVVHKAYSHLFKAMKQLENSVAFLLDDRDSLSDEVKIKTVTAMKMLTYIFIQFLLHFEQKRKRQETAPGRRHKEDEFTVDNMAALGVLGRLLNREICFFWEPPVVEHDYIAGVAELCLFLLQNPVIKGEKETRKEIFTLLGTLIKSHDYGKTFVARMVQLTRLFDHVAQIAPEGIKLVVEQFNCRPLVHYFVKEATEWQTDDTFKDNQGTRCCSTLLTELAVLMPELMIPEVMYLNQYLTYDSQPLRISVLNVLTEVILNVLRKHDLTEEEKESRDELLDLLIDHVRDYSALVRTKVIQSLGRLQKENAIPLNYQNDVLARVIEHLHDKGAAVRKAAIHCITIFLQHNPFGANLQLKKCEEELERKMELLTKMEASYREAKMAKIQELEAEWGKMEPEVVATIEQLLNENDDDDDDEEEEEADGEQQPSPDKDEMVEMIRSKLQEKKIVEAFKLCTKLKNQIDEWKNIQKVTLNKEVAIYVTILKSFYMNVVKITDELRTGAGMTEDDIKKIETLENMIKYLKNTVAFLRVIDSAIEPMKRLLFTQTIGDMHEAIKFFVTAYQFQIDNVSDGIIEMLKLMKYNEPERKEGVIEAFRTIYLTTDTKNLADHTTTVLNRLISLLKDITWDYVEDFHNIISEWTSKGILDNSIIDRCWHYYTKREPVSNEDSRAAAELLKMASTGRRTIISKNLALVTSVALSDNYKDDMRFLACSCRLLAVAGIDKIDIQSEDPPFTIKHLDPIFSNLSDILTEHFFKETPFYMEALDAGLNFIFRVCSKPIEVAERLLKQITDRLQGCETNKRTLLVVRLCQLLGRTASCLLGYLDNTVYRELKRRNYLREARKENKKKNNSNKKKRQSRRVNISALSNSLNDSTMNDAGMEGAEAIDDDAEFILKVLESAVVSKGGLLGQHVPFLTDILQRPDVYNSLTLQQVAVIALIRFMLVSEKFCRDNMRLLFTIFEKTNHPDVRCTILIHASDLLTRFPNTVEPWSPRIYAKLKDPLVQVRKTAFYSLSNLILRDMIRAHGHIAEMAACMIDEASEVRDMCKTFFRRLAQKEQNLANVMPDIFSHLVKMEEMGEEHLRSIMRFLFDLVDNSKRTENLVDRFCFKYTVNDDAKLNRNITYCLSLINYNDKALRKLHEKFPMYKHHLHDTEVYSIFKQILAECVKQKPGMVDLKPIVAEIEACIASVFELDENGQGVMPPRQVVKPVKKTRTKGKRKVSKKQDSTNSEGSEEEGAVTSGKKARRGRSRRTTTTSESD